MYSVSAAEAMTLAERGLGRFLFLQVTHKLVKITRVFRGIQKNSLPIRRDRDEINNHAASIMSPAVT